MKVRSVTELKTLDDELDLFSDVDWDFMSVVENRDENFEFFNDIRDTDFDKRQPIKFKQNVLPILTLVIALGTCVFVALRTADVFDFTEYNQVKNIASVNQASSISYVDGEEVSSEKFLVISGVLNNYFSCLKAESDYSSLYDYCKVTSNFADTYYSTISKIETIYDTADCYARALREFGGFFTLNKVSKIIEKDGTYYCYLSLSAPSSDDVYQYVYLYSYNFTKYFTSTKVTEANVIKYLLEVTKDNAIPCSATEICIKVVQSGNSYKIVDDSSITAICVDDYSEAVTQISRILGSNLISSM